MSVSPGSAPEALIDVQQNGVSVWHPLPSWAPIQVLGPLLPPVVQSGEAQVPHQFARKSWLFE